jgi:hypothetical protein
MLCNIWPCTNVLKKSTASIIKTLNKILHSTTTLKIIDIHIAVKNSNPQISHLRDKTDSQSEACATQCILMKRTFFLDLHSRTGHLV